MVKILADKDMNSIDVGANRGAYTFWLSRCSRRVIAIEPVEYLAKILMQVCPSNVQVLNLGVSDSVGSAHIYMPVNDGVPIEGEASVADPGSESIKISIELETLDSLGLSDIGFIKIDVEGHELKVLRGARETIAKFKPNILIEVEGRHIDYPVQEVFDEILEMGYEGFFLESNLKSLSEFNEEKHQNIKFLKTRKYINNFIFVPNEKAVSIRGLVCG